MKDAFVYTSFSVKDLAEAKEFYVDKLGFTMGAEMTDEALKVVSGGQRYHIYPKADHTPADFTLINFKVDDIAAAMAELKAKGISFEQYSGEGGITTDENGVASHGPRKMAWFKDPSGNIHGLGQGEG